MYDYGGFHCSGTDLHGPGAHCHAPAVKNVCRVELQVDCVDHRFTQLALVMVCATNADQDAWLVVLR